jgi:hypothetical protein
VTNNKLTPLLPNNMKTFCKLLVPAENVWKVWVTDENMDTYTAQLVSEIEPCHSKMVDFFNLFRFQFQKED